MKSFFLTLLSVTLSIYSFSQTEFYIKYESTIDSDDPQMEMMKSMMAGSYMVIASDGDKMYTKSVMGTVATTEVELDKKANNMTMLMTGMMGTMAFAGNPDSLSNNEDTTSQNFTLVDETKKIQGYKCKKATIEDSEGNVSTYWYTEDITPIKGVSQSPDMLPGVSLEMVIVKSMMTMTYTAVKVEEKVKMKDYVITIPEGTEVQTLEDLKNMGQGM